MKWGTMRNAIYVKQEHWSHGQSDQCAEDYSTKKDW